MISTTPEKTGLFLIVVVVAAVFNAHLTEGQYYCNGRPAVTLQWGGCNGTGAVCSDLMQAIATTWNWWATVNNTPGNSLGVAVHNFFTTDAYGQLLSITNNNTAYPTACKKIAAIVKQLLTWNATKSANVILRNATNAATARQKLFATVIDGWGYTIGQYIACGSTCTNYSSTMSTTSTTTTLTPTPTTTKYTTTSRPTITSTSTNPTVPPPNCSAVIFGNIYFPGNNITSSIDYISSMLDFPVGGSACSTPYSERLYFPGMNTPQSAYWGTGDVPSPFLPSAQSAVSAFHGCKGNVYNTVPQPFACLCSPNGSCYYLNGTGVSFELKFYSWCYNGDCVMYMAYCLTSRHEEFRNVATGEIVINCSAINAGGSREDCYPGSPNCSYLPVAYFACGPCPSALMEPPVCPGPIDPVCEGAPLLAGYENVANPGIPLVMAQPAPGENFPNITGPAILLGTCNNCSSPNTTQYFYTQGSSGQFTCMNGTNPAQVDWTGVCMCDQFGGCYQFRPLPDGSATLTSVVTMSVAYAKSAGLLVTVICQKTNAKVVVEDEKGNSVFACDGAYNFVQWYIFSLRCSGRCPTDQPLEIYCPGPYVPA